MHIADIKIRNFRKLKEIFIDLRDYTTVFIGANNSGKTSAMVAMRYFLKQDGDNFNVYDFTLSNHAKIQEIGSKLENEVRKSPDATGIINEPVKRDLSLWKNILPAPILPARPRRFGGFVRKLRRLSAVLLPRFAPLKPRCKYSVAAWKRV